jgi:hypothetical protein
MTETDPEKRLIGYVCISTYGQMLDTQLSRASPSAPALRHRSAN